MTEQEEEYPGAMQPFSEDHYRLAMEVAKIGMWDWDLIQDKQTWTWECREMLGLGPEDDVSYERLLALVTPDDSEKVKGSVEKSLREHTEYNAEYRVIWPDKSVHWIHARGRGMYNAAGQATRMIGVVMDVTVRKEAEEVQQRAAKSVRDIVESVEEAFAHLDSQWRFTYVNSRAARIGRELAEAEILGREIWAVYPELLGTDTEYYLRQTMRTRQPTAYEIYYPDIQSWFDIRVYPVEDGGLTIFLTDINERKFLEQERHRLLDQERAARIEAETARSKSEELVVQLEQKQALLLAIMHQVPSGFLIAEAETGEVICYSEEATKMLGPEVIKRETYLQVTNSYAMHPDRTPLHFEEYPMVRALLHGEVTRQEHVLYHCLDGREVHLNINAAPIYDAQGKILAAVVTFNDVSEHFELERKKDEFICMASHELRTPLTSIKGNLQLAHRYLQRWCDNEGNLNIEGREAAEQLAQWNERALRQVNVETRLVNDLLDASRIQTESLRVALERGNLVQIVCEAVGDVQAVVPTRNITLELPAQSDIPVMADAVRIGQVITNYLSNALKYSDENDPVGVGLALEKSEARVWVRDAGPGIAPEALRYIWDRFRQVGSFVDYTRQGGLGLGLYINHALIQLHGGRSGVESAHGKGSIFWFSLPLAFPDR